MMYKPNIGDIVYFNGDLTNKHVVAKIQELRNGDTLIYVVCMDDIKTGHNGWFNSNKVSVLTERYFPTAPEYNSKDPDNQLKELEVTFTAGDASLQDPVLDE